MLSSGLAEWPGIVSTHQPRKRSHAALRRDPAEYVTMFRHEVLQEFKVSGSGFLRLSENNVPFADGYFRKNFAGSAVGNGEIGARVPVLLAALCVVLDHPSCAHTGN